MDKPPILNSEKPPVIGPMPPPQSGGGKSQRIAILMNLVCPGAGQLYFGQWLLGVVLLVTFLICFFGSVGLLLRGYGKFLDSAISGKDFDLNAMPLKWILGYLIGGIVVLLVSLFTLRKEERKP